MSDITNDFTSAQNNLAEARGVGIEFWTITCDKLLIELRDFTGEESSFPSIADRSADRSAD